MLLKGYLRVEEVAKQLGLSEYRVRELIREKQIIAKNLHMDRCISYKRNSESYFNHV